MHIVSLMYLRAWAVPNHVKGQLYRGLWWGQVWPLPVTELQLVFPRTEGMTGSVVEEVTETGK